MAKTEATAAEAEARAQARAQAQADEKYRVLAENIPVQVWTSLPDGKLDFVTEQTARSFGVSAETLLRDGWKDVLHPDDVPLAVERWTRSLTTGEPYEVEFRLRLADGTYAWHLARAVAQRSAVDGTIHRWLGSNTNIEAQREQQRRVQALLDEVTLQARESARLIAELQTANAELQTANADATKRIAELEAELRSR